MGYHFTTYSLYIIFLTQSPNIETDTRGAKAHHQPHVRLEAVNTGGFH